MKIGVILNNIGSPNAPDTKSVRVYLREFLMDPQVIELPFLLRFILVYFIITPFRAVKSAEKYQKIWTKAGSPLIVVTESIAQKIQSFKKDIAVTSGMVFQNPSISEAIEKLSRENPDLEKIYFIPMYPQFSAATTESSINKFKSVFIQHQKTFIKNNKKSPDVFALKPFYDSDFFINPYVEKIRKFDLNSYDCIVFSYHGLPTSAILKNPHCRLDSTCCDTGMSKNCYRSQCLATTKAIVTKLNPTIRVLTTFQSRLGRGEWIKPYTDLTLAELAKSSVGRVLIICPAFTVDCLETLEEIQIENKNIFLSSGGIVFDYVACPNDDEQWCKNLTDVITTGTHFDRL